MDEFLEKFFREKERVSTAAEIMVAKFSAEVEDPERRRELANLGITTFAEWRQKRTGQYEMPPGPRFSVRRLVKEVLD